MQATTFSDFKIPDIAASSIEKYQHYVCNMPLITAEEESALFDIVENGTPKESKAAFDRLVISALRFVVYVARTYSGYGLSHQDLIQEGNMGLIKAVKKFDRTKGIRLCSFAVTWIKSDIHYYIYNNWRTVKIVTSKNDRKLFFNIRKYPRSNTWLNLTEAEAISKDLGISVADVMVMDARMHSPDQSIFMEDGETMEFMDDNDPYDVFQMEEDSRLALETLEKGFKKLNPRQADIITKRWLTEDKVGLKELAAEYSVSMERIRQIENDAMKKIREAA